METENELRKETKNLSAIRTEIDRVDEEFSKLFLERMELCADVAEYKKAHNLPVLNGAREEEILSRMAGKADETLAPSLMFLYRTVFELSRSYQESLLSPHTSFADTVHEAMEHTPKAFPTHAAVACQGLSGSYASLAAKRMFAAPSLTYVKHFEDVFRAVETGLCEYGVLPIENSSTGSVNEVYDLMKRHRFSIVRSTRLAVDHSLLALPGAEISGIREVYSHPQALTQCSEFFRTHPNIRAIPVENTAAAAKLTAESGRKDIAALASPYCGELYGLTSLSDSVQENAHNYTRFICISRELRIFPGADRISLMLSAEHRPGSLAQLLMRFAAAGLNLTKLESRPIPGRDFEFVFYFDLEASLYREETLRLLSSLFLAQPNAVFLGSYSEVVR